MDYPLPRIYSPEDRALAQRRNRYLILSFRAWVTGIALLIASGIVRNETLGLVSMLPLFVGGLSYLGSLAALAGQFGRSRIVWIGGIFVTGPLGLIYSYYAMQRRIAKHNLFEFKKKPTTT